MAWLTGRGDEALAYGTGQPGQYTFWQESLPALPGNHTVAVNVGTGNLLVTARDITPTAANGYIELTRYYNSRIGHSSFDPWSSNIGQELRVYISGLQANQVGLTGPSGFDAVFAKRADGTLAAPDGFDGTLSSVPEGGWLLERKRMGDAFRFSASGFLIWTRDAQNRRFDVTGLPYTPTSYGPAGGAKLQISAGGARGGAAITRIQEPSGRLHVYDYHGAWSYYDGPLAGYDGPDLGRIAYTYNNVSSDKPRLTAIDFPNGARAEVVYDRDPYVYGFDVRVASLKVRTSSTSAFSTTRFTYTTTSTTVTRPDGSQVVYSVDPATGRAQPVKTVVHGREFTANPTVSGQLLANEWVDTANRSARHEESSWLATRGIVACDDAQPSGPRCGEVRERTTYSDADPTQADTYYVQRGLSVDDPNLKNVADLLEANPSVGSADARGPLGQALQAWQVPPPLHGGEYLRFTSNDVLSTGDAADGVDGEQPEPAGLDVKTIVWVDEATQLPLKLRTERLDGTLLDESYWTYDPSRIDAASLPSDFFLAPRPVNVEQDEQVIAQSSGLTSTARADELSGLGFEPYFLGESFTAAQGRFCLARLAVIRLQEPPEDPAGSGGAEAGVNPSGRTVMVNAAYNAIEASERCRAHRGPLTAPDLEVNTAASTGATAAAWRSGYRRHGVAAPSSGPPPAFDPSLGPAALDADPSTIRLVALNARSSAVLGEKGRTTVSIVGPHERAMPSQVADLLERLEVSR